MVPNKRRDAFLALGAFALLAVAFFTGFSLMHRTTARSGFLDVCDLVDQKFYLNDDNLHRWVSSCRKHAMAMPLFASHDELIREIQDQMDVMHVSHFMIYSPDEDRKLWKGQALETGLRARWMEDKLIIYQVLPNSPSEEAGFQLGDEVMALDGREPRTADEVTGYSGRYTLKRQGKTFELKLAATAIAIDSSPSIRPLKDEIGLIDLSSFRSEYFEEKSWRNFVNEWKPYRKLIIDLRENVGGNFVAVLRALSPFFCTPTRIGDLVQQRKNPDHQADLENNLADEDQINQMDRDPIVILRTFAGYGCYDGPVDVLVGAHTSSVSEIFASAMERRPRTRVAGQPTAGDVVLAIWYDMPSVGPGFSISIPEALFKTPGGDVLEGIGVYPKLELYDDLKIWQTGHDSWIQAVLTK